MTSVRVFCAKAVLVNAPRVFFFPAGYKLPLLKSVEIVDILQRGIRPWDYEACIKSISVKMLLIQKFLLKTAAKVI